MAIKEPLPCAICGCDASTDSDSGFTIYICEGVECSHSAWGLGDWNKNQRYINSIKTDLKKAKAEIRRLKKLINGNSTRSGRPVQITTGV
jgi:hypothetical protein